VVPREGPRGRARVGLPVRETFSEGLQVFDNPWAENPLDLGVLRDVTEHELVDGLVRTTTSRLEKISSITHLFQGPRAKQEARETLAILLGAGPGTN
jgi:hypothetical protein